ncbi:MAG TPA: DHHA1 domain-containing protein, partial [Prolixibacteraceae bacterium]|nr:DHHA1 domain-containing protein [Prolixibacteraceae bacterium]
LTLNNPQSIPASVSELIDSNKELSKQLEAFAKKEAMGLKSELKNNIEKMGDINVLTAIVPLNDAQLIKDLAFQLKGEIDNLFLVLGANLDGKANLTVMISDNLVNERKLNAGQIIRDAAKAIQGGGGGQAFYATAGGKNPDGLNEALNIAKKALA